MATEDLGGPIFSGDDLIIHHRKDGQWTTHTRPDLVRQQADMISRLSERMAAERVAERERIMANPGLRFLHWFFQTDVWKEHKAAR